MRRSSSFVAFVATLVALSAASGSGSSNGVSSRRVQRVANEALVLGDLKATATPAVDEDDAPRACAADMIEVVGDYCPWVDQHCLRYLESGPDEPKIRCAEFRRSGACNMTTEHKHFCIDRYEWPNRRGEVPPVSLTWYDAKASCASIGKRLCQDDEWTLACEGHEHLPYPYGYARNSEACNTDRTYRTPDNQLYIWPPTRAAEVVRLDQREPSGARESCVSPYGVYDMAGNVDEWVTNETQRCKPFCSGLKGGAWTPVRNRCRPMTTGHEEKFHYYQVGFRCCAELLTKKSAGK
jgi:sulfatase modifying factor 1